MTVISAVHPRVCGELAGIGFFVLALDGSSPRVRGTRRHDPRGGLPGPRFIPACAGNSRRSAARQSCIAGSSPRVRGTRRARREGRPGHAVHPRVCGELERVGGGLGRGLRFIPACAGNSMSLANRSTPTFGSSPRVRGTHCPALQRQCAHRFIPACAGNSTSASTTTTSRPVHPRVCGELELRMLLGRDRVRFIPACAGNSGVLGRLAQRLPVHPRVCGELSVKDSVPTDVYGSSPRVRGTRFPRPARRTQRRFIPACAGNSA